jgi:hypothetical protein
MPQALMINGRLIGIFTTEDTAQEWVEENKPEATYQIFGIDVMYKTDFTY